MKRMRAIIIAALGLLGLAIGALFSFPIVQKNFVTIEINGASLIAQVAADRAARIRGLSGREGLAGNEAVLFLFDSPDRYGLWMKEMKFPIDIFWIRNSTVIDMEEHVPPPLPGMSEASLPIYLPEAPADMALETRAEFAKDHKVRIGDKVRIRGRRGIAWASSTFDSMRGDASPSRGGEYFIENLRAHPPHGSDFKINKVLATTDDYAKFAIAYRSDKLMITGVMNVPFGPIPPNGFPMLILNHGLIHPSIYFSGRGSKREQDFFTRHGYVTIHPDYRGLASSSPNTVAHHDFYEGYAADVLALIDALEKKKPSLIDLDRIGMWGHSMGGGIAARIMVRDRDVRAYVLFAPISADAEDNFYELTDAEIRRLRKAYGDAGDEAYRKISPITYFNDVSAPVQIHHGLADKDVPIAFSQKIFSALTAGGKKAELYTYPGEKHEFIKAWSLAAGRALQFFDRYVKNAR